MSRPSLLTFCLLVSTLVSCERTSVPDGHKSGGQIRSARISTDSAAFVDDSSCVDCHEDIHETYQHVGMSQSFGRPDTMRLIEDFEAGPYYHEPSDRYYEMEKRGDRIFQRRYQLDSAGQRINQFEEEVDWIIGSGHHGRTYVFQNPAGELFGMPLHWYSQTQSWAMGPGYDHADHAGFSRRITRDCMFCHNAFPDYEAGSDELHRPPLFPEKLPEGIGCQRCHGPGEAHVELAMDATDAASVADWKIVNPTSLDEERCADVCMQCHLQPHSLFNSISVIPGRSGYSFRPGESFTDFCSVVDFTTPESRASHFQINHHAYRMRQSRCFTESDNALSCLTCHDPHALVNEREKLDHYRSACLACHQQVDCHEIASWDEQKKAKASCVSCHMPQRRPSDVPMATMTDHWIRADIESEDERLAPPVAANQAARQLNVSVMYGSQDQALRELSVAMAATTTSRAEDIDALKSLLSTQQVDSIEPLLVLAGAQLKTGQHQDAFETLKKIEENFPDVAAAKILHGQALLKQGSFAEAKEQFESVTVADATPELHFGLGTANLNLGNKVAAEKSLQRALELRPNYVDALMNLGIMRMQQRNFEAASELFSRAASVDPRAMESYLHLGTSQLYMGRNEQALRFWMHGYRNTKAPVLAEGGVIALLQMGKLDEALLAVERIRDGDPCITPLVKALVLKQRGDSVRAGKLVLEARKLAQQHPSASQMRKLLMQSVEVR